MRTVSRYLLTEIAGVFAVALSILCATFFVQRILAITEWAINRGVGFLDIMRMVLYIFPMLLIVLIPIVTLFAILIAVGRLSSDSEITVLKATGVGLHQLLVPVLVFSAFACLLTLYTSLFLVPEANRKTRELQYRIIKTRTQSALPVRSFVEFLENQFFFVKEKGPEGLRGVLIFQDVGGKKNNPIPLRTRIVAAKEGVFQSDPERLENFMLLKDGALYNHDLETKRDQFIRFERLLARLDIKEAGSSGDPGVESRESDLPELILGMRQLREQLEQAAENGEDSEETEQALAVFRLAFHERVAFPCSCLLLALWALPLGMQEPRSGRLRPVILSVFVSMVFYYMIILGKALALKGSIPPPAAFWVPNAFFLLVGIYLFNLKRLERPIPVLSLLEEYVYLLQEYIRRRWAERSGGAP